MPSLDRTLAARANGARSRGPVTPEGKQRSSQNALRHGLLAQCILLRDESPEAFQALLDQHLARLDPADNLELGMIEEMAASFWRIRRAWALETRILDNEVAAQTEGDRRDRMAAAFSSLAAKPALGLMHRYETRLHLIYQRALHNLLLLRAAVPNEPKPAPCPPAAIPNEPKPGGLATLSQAERVDSAACPPLSTTLPDQPSF